MKRALRTRALKLRQHGWSYNVIREKLGVSKSTLSHWLRYVPFKPNRVVQKRIANGALQSAIAKSEQRLKSIRDARAWAEKEITSLSDRDLFMLGIGLYIGEGSKLYEDVQFINSDPQTIQIMVRWFRTILKVPLYHFKAAIHIYPDTSEKVALRYWSHITGIPLSQFGKTSIDRRTNKSLKKKRMLPYGTAHIRVRACGNPLFGVQLHRRIIGLIDQTYKHMRV